MNWPHNFIAEKDLLILAGNNEQQVLEQQLTTQNDNKDVLLANYTDQLNANTKQQESKTEDDIGDGQQWGIEDVELNEQQPVAKSEQTHQKVPSSSQQTKLDMSHFKVGTTQSDYFKLNESVVAHDQISISQYKKAGINLEKQISLKNKANLQDTIKSIIITQTQLIAQIPFLNFHQQSVNQSHLGVEVKNLIKLGYKLTTEGKFVDTLKTFQNVLKIIPVLKVFTQNDEQEIKQDIQLCKNYILAMQFELEKKKNTEDQGRILQLACFMALCKLQPAHKILTLRAAMTTAFKQKNFVTTTHLAKRLINLIETAPLNAVYAKAEIVVNAKKVLTSSEQQGTNTFKFEFDDRWLYDDMAVDKICAEKFTIIEKLKGKCPFDFSCYSHLPIVCNVCLLSGFGEDTIGLKILQ